MTTTVASYALSGPGVTIGYSAGSAALQIVLDESFTAFEGTYDTTGTPSTEPVGGAGWQINAEVTRKVAGRGDSAPTKLGIRLFLVSPGDSLSGDEVTVSGAAVFTTAEYPEVIRSETLAGTMSVPATVTVGRGGRGGRGGR